MHLLDIIIIVLALIFGATGYFSGLLAQLSTPLALLAGAACAWYGQPFLAQRMQDWFAIPLAVSFCAALAGFAGGVILVKLAAAIAGALLKRDEGNRRADGVCGAALGLGKGLLLASAVVFLAATFGKREMMRDALLAPPLYELSIWGIDKADTQDLWQSARDWGDVTIRDNVSAEDIGRLLRYFDELPRDGQAGR